MIGVLVRRCFFFVRFIYRAVFGFRFVYLEFFLGDYVYWSGRKFLQQGYSLDYFIIRFVFVFFDDWTEGGRGYFGEFRGFKYFEDLSEGMVRYQRLERLDFFFYLNIGFIFRYWENRGFGWLEWLVVGICSLVVQFMYWVGKQFQFWESKRQGQSGQFTFEADFIFTVFGRLFCGFFLFFGFAFSFRWCTFLYY